MKAGDRVELLDDPGDLRQELRVGCLGTITGGPYPTTGLDHRPSEWYWVHWDGQDEALRMFEGEFRVV